MPRPSYEEYLATSDNGDGEHDKDKPCEEYDPCKCAPGSDKEIIFNRQTCLSADPRFLWDYIQGLLTIDGRLAASGYISSGSQVEGAYLAPQALGLGSFNFTPPSGYGGWVYRGGSIFYYWNDLLNVWEEVDFGGSTVTASTVITGGSGIQVTGSWGDSQIIISSIPGSSVQLINIARNGSVLGTPNTINFQDSSSVTWTVNSNGSVSASALGSSIWNSNVNAGGYNLTNLNNLYVNGNLYYKGLILEDWLSSSGAADLWTLAGDGSIYRDSNVLVTGPGAANSLDGGPFQVVSTQPVNYLYLGTQTGVGLQWAAFGAKLNGVYGGELGFSDGIVELWTSNSLILEGIDTGTRNGDAYFPGRVGIGTSHPDATLTVYYDADPLASGNVAIRTEGAWGGGLSLVDVPGHAHADFFTTTIPEGIPNLRIGVAEIGTPVPEFLTIGADNRMGILNSTPGANLDVNGTIRTMSNYTSVAWPTLGTGIIMWYQVATDRGLIQCLDFNTNELKPLEMNAGTFILNGNAFASSAVPGGITLNNITSINGAAPFPAYYHEWSYVANRPNINFSEGTGITLQVYDVSTSLGVSVIVTNSAPSDIRLKQNVKKLKGGLSIINQLQPVEFEYNGLAGTKVGKRAVSVVAQDIQEILPGAIEPCRRKLYPTASEETEILGITTNEILFQTILAVQQLDSRLKKLEI